MINKHKKFLTAAVFCAIASTGFVLTASAEETMTHDLDEVVVEADKDALPGGYVKTKGSIGILGEKSVLDVPFSNMNITQKTIVFHLFIPDASVTVQTDMDAVRLQLLEKRNQRFCLQGRLTAGESNTSFLPEECLLADSHLQNLFRSGGSASFYINRIRIGTIQTTERTSLQENDEPETRPVECSHTFVGVYIYHITFFRGMNG